MDVIVPLFWNVFSHLTWNVSSHLPTIFNLNSEEYQHLYYQVLAMKILIFIYMAKTMFPAGCYMIFLCILYTLRSSVGIGSRLSTTVHYIAIVTSANIVSMPFLYLLVLLSAIVMPELELLIDTNLFSSGMYLLYHYYFVPQLYRDIFVGSFAFAFINCFVLSKVVPISILWSMAVFITLQLCMYFKDTIPLAWAHLAGAYIIWLVHV